LGDIVVNFLGINVSTVMQDDALLFFIKVYLRVAWYSFISYWVTIEKALHWLAIPEVGANNLRRILSLDMGIENALRFNDYIGTLLAETMTASEIHLNIS